MPGFPLDSDVFIRVGGHASPLTGKPICTEMAHEEGSDWGSGVACLSSGR